MIYQLSISGCYFSTRGKKFFNSQDELFTFLLPIYEESLDKSRKVFGSQFSLESFYSSIRITCIDTYKIPDYEKYFSEKKMRKFQIVIKED